ncbi:MAG: hypothetical protein LBJ10_02870 [Clostridiales bacterium]|jgi:hypothetical protein|nr:hypothetical protein [Clostridiales bacterium]
MSNAAYKMAGIFCIILSIFALLGGIFLPAPVVPALANRLCWIVGLALLAGGVVLYKVARNENEA